MCLRLSPPPSPPPTFPQAESEARAQSGRLAQSASDNLDLARHVSTLQEQVEAAAAVAAQVGDKLGILEGSRTSPSLKQALTR